ncbi:MAG: sigma-70 family RNA polymerase sigma factor [Polyangiaceae bacterium]|nr:sigma-70 family RNA polymerase sigma factor [Polyangiaceae bacterium]
MKARRLGTGQGRRVGRGADAVRSACAQGADPRLREALDILARVARALYRRLGDVPGVPLDELLGHGHVVVVELLRDYDPSRGIFRAYAARRIVWGLLDALRRDTHARARVTRAAAVAVQRRMRERRLARSAREPDAARAARGLRALLEAHAAGLVLGLGSVAEHEPVESPEHAVLRREQARALWSEVAALPDPRQRALIVHHYRHGVPFDVAARDLGVSKSWASRLHGQALGALAARLERAARDEHTRLAAPRLVPVRAAARPAAA